MNPIVIGKYNVTFDGARFATVYNPKTDVIYEVSRPFFQHGYRPIDYQGAGGAVRSLTKNGPRYKEILKVLDQAIEELPE